MPSLEPSASPSTAPSVSPSSVPSSEPSGAPSLDPSSVPSAAPSLKPSTAPSAGPSSAPSSDPSLIISAAPSLYTSASPSYYPSFAPTNSPSTSASNNPTLTFSSIPSTSPSIESSSQPSSYPSSTPSDSPTEIPKDCLDEPGWYDTDGPTYNCEWYSDPNRDHCEAYGDGFENFGKTAKEACCHCGGGIRFEYPSASPTIPQAVGTIKANSAIFSSSTGSWCLEYDEFTENVSLQECNGVQRQSWLFDNSFGFIRSGLNTNKCMTSDSFSSGAAISLVDCGSANHQSWDLDANYNQGPNSGLIKLQFTNFCISHNDGGNDVMLWGCDDFYNYYFTWDF